MGIAYLIYKRIRPGLGLPFGFILMYGLFAYNFSFPLLLAAAGFFLIELYGYFYNDYWDYQEDLRNKRTDKFHHLLNRTQLRNLGFLIAAAGLVALAFTNFIVLGLGIYYVLLFVCYSHPKVRLKGSLKGYGTLSSMFLFLPPALATFLPLAVPVLIFFSLFFFCQFMYILCQKDSTDSKDFTNLFKLHGWSRATGITVLFGVLSSAFLFLLCLINPILIFVWIFNLLVKFLNLNKIQLKTITRTQRSRLVLLEFLTPYLFVGGGLFV